MSKDKRRQIGQAVSREISMKLANCLSYELNIGETDKLKSMRAGIYDIVDIVMNATSLSVCHVLSHIAEHNVDPGDLAESMNSMAKFIKHYVDYMNGFSDYVAEAKLREETGVHAMTTIN